ncbi:hypothetical protein BOX15_Mlig002298g1 [Macrostomum lignano]|uniref:Uncharacterized protein n=1 Tax=Macrostomum lignano TaxID=282301 RepID=A0A267GYR8_9PLAT|nr:hypothetical protein BOX15_Mlig002298g1 [Macrostomum lignano]
MGWKLKKRTDVEPLLPLKHCLCFDNRMGTFIGCIIITITAFVELVTVFLDWLTYDENLKFEIHGAFRSFWKRLFWKGFAICDGIMTLAHIIIIVMAVYVLVAILRPRVYKIYDLLPALKGFYILLSIYILVELGISCYVYSWYGLAGWRLPFLVWKNLFYIIRFLCNVGFCLVIYSYACEIDSELGSSSGDKAAFGNGDDPINIDSQQLQQQQQQLLMHGGNPYSAIGSYAASDVYAQA